MILTGSVIFNQETQIITNIFKGDQKFVRGTEILSEKIGPGTKIFRTKIPVIRQ